MKCVLCESKDYKKLFELGNFEIKRCTRCGLVRTFGSRKRDYQDYHRDPDYKKFEKHFRNIFQKRFNLIKRKERQTGRVLEIGCSTGLLLSIFQKNGWEGWGIEPSRSARLAKKRKLKVFQTTLEKAQLPPKYFDVIIMNHVLEHLTDPLGALKKVKSLLKDKGLVYIDVPNFGSFSACVSREYWKFILPEEHVHHFTPITLKKLIKKAGFKISYQKTWSGIFDVANPVKKIYLELSHPFIFIATLLDLPGNLISTFLNQGTNLVIIGRK